MASHTLNGKTFSIEELKSISVDEGQTEFEKSTIKFCKAWLSGQQEFKIQTSGSTGAPKKIILTRSSMEVSARMTIHALQLNASDTALVCLDTKYIAGQMMLVRSLMLGMNIVAVKPSANPFKNSPLPIDFTALVPYQLETILTQSLEKWIRVAAASLVVGALSIKLKA